MGTNHQKLVLHPPPCSLPLSLSWFFFALSLILPLPAQHCGTALFSSTSYKGPCAAMHSSFTLVGLCTSRHGNNDCIRDFCHRASNHHHHHPSFPSSLSPFSLSL